MGCLAWRGGVCRVAVRTALAPRGFIDDELSRQQKYLSRVMLTTEKWQDGLFGPEGLSAARRAVERPEGQLTYPLPFRPDFVLAKFHLKIKFFQDFFIPACREFKALYRVRIWCNSVKN